MRKVKFTTEYAANQLHYCRGPEARKRYWQRKIWTTPRILCILLYFWL